MYSLEHILDIAQICSQRAIQNAVLCPGSRSAPLNIAFAMHPKIRAFSVVDERSAAFVALGLAQSTQKATVLCCSSGTAGLNFAPAVAEAFYAQVPLLVLTADRPPEWIDQQDGQTIRQYQMFGKHVKASYQMPTGNSKEQIWHAHRIINEALDLAHEFPQAPVHINCPFREPFYPPKDYQPVYGKPKVWQKITAQKTLSPDTFSHLAQQINQAQKVLIVGGQANLDQNLVQVLSQNPAVVIADIISNLHGVKNAVQHQDKFLDAKNQALLGNADLLISFGKSVISKQVKAFLRNYPPQQHWHLQSRGVVADTFQALSQIIEVDTLYFFENIKDLLEDSPPKQAYRKQWAVLNEDFAKKQIPIFCEAQAMKTIMATLPNVVLHLANSMAVRYANVFGLKNAQVEVFSNRGTSGIDGSNSTALGHALAQKNRQHLLITGDLAFFYDQNAFWYKDFPKNLKIILLNNGGGGIFDILDAPKNIPQVVPYFLTTHQQNAQFLAQNYGFQYWAVHQQKDFEVQLQAFYECPQACILEIFTDMTTNTQVWKNL